MDNSLDFLGCIVYSGPKEQRDMVASTAECTKTENPYFDEFKLFQDTYDPYSLNGYMEFEVRDRLTHKYSWAIPNDTALSVIAEYGPIVEIGAGTGYWVYLLRQRKVNIIAYDNALSANKNTSHYHGGNEVWTVIERGTYRMLKHHPDRTLLLCWPPYNTKFASNCLRHYRGDTLVYVGEGKGGCTGNDTFFDMLDKEWEVINTVDIPHWESMHDYVSVYKKGKKQ